jgi:hypothetical protein
MAHIPIGFGIYGVIRGVVGVAVAIAVIWFIYKLGKLADAYTVKIKGKS